MQQVDVKHSLFFYRASRVRRSLLRGRSDGRAVPREAEPFTPLIGPVDKMNNHFGSIVRFLGGALNGRRQDQMSDV
jgi:hypothetical protein